MGAEMRLGAEEIEREERALYGDDEGYCCPTCGEKCETLTDFHVHNEREHGERPGRGR